LTWYMDIIGTELADLYVNARNWVVMKALGTL
jgi:hypothetical protein